MKNKRKKHPPMRKSGKPASFKKELEATAANAGLTKRPTPALVAVIDTIIGILQDRGVIIRDWDDKDKVVRKMRCIGSRVFILAPREKPGTEAAHGKDGERQQEQ